MNNYGVQMSDFVKNLAKKYKYDLLKGAISNPQCILLAAMGLPFTMEERCQLYREYGISVGNDCFIDFGVWIEPGIPSRLSAFRRAP